MKTIKQIADGLGIDKQKVYRYIKVNDLNEAHQEGIKKYYDDVVETLIIEHFTKNNASNEAHQSAREAHQSASSDVLEMLQILQNQLAVKDKQLDVKDKQIEELNAQLRDLTAALTASNQLAAAAQALHAGTINKQLIESAGDNQTTPKKNIWNKIFGRDRSG